MERKINSLTLYHKERVKVLGKNSPAFLDETMIMTHRVCFDVIAFNDWYEQTFGKIPDGTSLHDAVLKRYGQETVDFMRRWM